MTTMTDEALLTPKDLAKRWSMSEKTLANHRCNGTGVPYVKLGTAVRYLVSDVLAFEKRITGSDVT